MKKTDATVNTFHQLSKDIHTDTVLLQLNHNPDDLIDTDSEPETKGGQPRTTLLHDVTRSCKTISSGKPRYRCAMKGCLQSWSRRRQVSRVYNHLLTECLHVDSDTKEQITKATSVRTLHSQLQDSVEDSGTIEKVSKSEGKKARGLKVNQAVLNLICGTGIAPTIVDSAEWKHVVDILDSTVNVYSSSSFADTYIPAEAVRITEEAIKKLLKIKNLTISYDGGTTKAVESIYTIHVTTPSRRSYLIEGSEKSGISHTGPQIAKELLKVLYSIQFLKPRI